MSIMARLFRRVEERTGRHSRAVCSSCGTTSLDPYNDGWAPVTPDLCWDCSFFGEPPDFSEDW